MNPIDEEKRNNPHNQTSHIKAASQHALFSPKQQLLNIPSDVSSGAASILTLDSEPNLPKVPFKVKFYRCTETFKEIITSKELKRKLPPKVTRFSIVLFFTGYFLTLQPYSNSIANNALAPHDSVKITVGLVLFATILVSFYDLLKTCNSTKKLSIYDRFNHQKRKKRVAVGALITVITAQSLLVTHLLTNFLVQYLAPIFFALSCLTFMINCCLSKQGRNTKVLFSVLFLIEALGATALSLNVLDVMPSLTHTKLWSQYILPITLIVSLACAAFTTFEPCFIAFYRKTNQSLSDLSVIADSPRSQNIVEKSSSKIYRVTHQKQPQDQILLFNDQLSLPSNTDNKNLTSSTSQIKIISSNQSTLS